MWRADRVAVYRSSKRRTAWAKRSYHHAQCAATATRMMLNPVLRRPCCAAPVMMQGGRVHSPRKLSRLGCRMRDITAASCGHTGGWCQARRLNNETQPRSCGPGHQSMHPPPTSTPSTLLTSCSSRSTPGGSCSSPCSTMSGVSSTLTATGVSSQRARYTCGPGRG